jgi:hypothetical protein
MILGVDAQPMGDAGAAHPPHLGLKDMATPTMFSRPVTCGVSGCHELAEYKIAAPWSVGRFSELKTYGISCEAHSTQAFRDALRRRKMHLYRFEKGKATTKLEPVPNPEG